MTLDVQCPHCKKYTKQIIRDEEMTLLRCEARNCEKAFVFQAVTYHMTTFWKLDQIVRKDPTQQR